MNPNLKRLLRQASQHLPRSRGIYWLARHYADFYNGEHNCDIVSNGEMRFLRMYVSAKRPVVILDVGANVGKWCSLALQLNPRASIHCFEPNPAAFNKLASRDFPANVHLNSFALGSTSGSMKFQIYGETAGTNSLYLHPGRQAIRAEEVRVEIMADYCVRQGIEYIDYLKIDVEGAEFEVLKGASPLLATQRIQAAQFEYGEGYIGARVFLKDVLEFLGQFPYDVYKILPRGLLPITDYDIKLENFHNANYALIARESRLTA